jgi:PAB1-binding protein PBP1
MISGKTLLDIYLTDNKIEATRRETKERELMQRFGLHKIDHLYKDLARGKYNL